MNNKKPLGYANRIQFLRIFCLLFFLIGLFVLINTIREDMIIAIFLGGALISISFFYTKYNFVEYDSDSIYVYTVFKIYILPISSFSEIRPFGFRQFFWLTLQGGRRFLFAESPSTAFFTDTQEKMASKLDSQIRELL